MSDQPPPGERWTVTFHPTHSAAYIEARIKHDGRNPGTLILSHAEALDFMNADAIQWAQKDPRGRNGQAHH